MDPRFELKQHRPWPPMYRNHPVNGRGAPTYCYRPVPLDTLAQWITPHIPEYNYMPAPRMPGNPNKSRDYYYLAPLYRNAMPPPPPPQPMTPLQVSPVAIPPPGMMLMERPRGGRAKSSGGPTRSVPPCTCAVGRTRSLEDVRSEVSEWDDYHDENGNRLQRSSPKGANVCRQVRRSMENLLDVDAEERTLNTFERVGKFCKRSDERRNDAKSARQRGSYMVRAGCCFFFPPFLSLIIFHEQQDTRVPEHRERVPGSQSDVECCPFQRFLGRRNAVFTSNRKVSSDNG